MGGVSEATIGVEKMGGNLEGLVRGGKVFAMRNISRVGDRIARWEITGQLLPRLDSLTLARQFPAPVRMRVTV